MLTSGDDKNAVSLLFAGTLCADFLVVVGASSSESLLLELAACFGFATGVNLVIGVVGFVFFWLSSDESESDDESFFAFFGVATGVDTAGFFNTGVTATTSE